MGWSWKLLCTQMAPCEPRVLAGQLPLWVPTSVPAPNIMGGSSRTSQGDFFKIPNSIRCSAPSAEQI